MDEMSCSIKSAWLFVKLEKMDSQFVNFLSKYRTQLMGGAMILVLFHHMWCWPYSTVFLQVFKFGYFGVDVFLLLSGFGLCYSYEKHSLWSFYIRRFQRIIPLYWLAVLLLICFGYLFHFKEYSLIQSISYLTTLGYYGIGSEISNWFVSAIVLLYLLFPLFYKATSKHPYIVLAVCDALALVSLYCFPIDWRFECLIARVPSFVFGIICYLTMKKGGKLTIPFYLSVLTLVIGINYNISAIFYVASFCPIFLCLLFSFPINNVIKSKTIGAALLFCGKKSYALFTSNIITAWFLDYINDIHPEWIHAYTKVPMYIVLSVLWAYIFIKAEKLTDSRKSILLNEKS